MNANRDNVRRGNPLRVAVWCTAALLLALPWLAMHFTTEVAWDIFDFIVFGAMLLIACGAYEIATRLSGSKAYRLAAGIALLSAFLLVWVSLAVGLIGAEGDPFDRLYFGVLAVGLIGAFRARFRARGMALALFATAFTQALVVVIALVAGKHHSPASSVGEIMAGNALFIALWISSAWMFRKAEEERSSSGRLT